MVELQARDLISISLSAPTHLCCFEQSHIPVEYVLFEASKSLVAQYFFPVPLDVIKSIGTLNEAKWTSDVEGHLLQREFAVIQYEEAPAFF